MAAKKKHIPNTGLKNLAALPVVPGVILLGSTLLALLLTNSRLWNNYNSIFHTPWVDVSIFHNSIALSLEWLINDGLMTIFFLVVGLEIKRELRYGELSGIKKATLPVVAATGGMVFPALIYLAFNFNTPASAGWGIPIATDIAFSLGILSLVVGRSHPSLGIFLAAFAIADDIGAVIVIAAFYTSSIHIIFVSLVLAFTILLFFLNILRVRTISIYVAGGILIWVFALLSGIHATIAGVLLALVIPSQPDKKYGSPLLKVEKFLSPLVSFLIMPLFALANAGIHIEGPIFKILLQPVSMGILAGLIIGKQAGIFSFAWLSTRIGITRLPSNTLWREMYGVAWLGGIGFTMSIFITNLAFRNQPELIAQAKVAIIAGSFISSIGGYITLKTISKKNKA